MSQLIAQQYQAIHQQSAVAYADDHQLIQMLYDGLIERIHSARYALEKGGKIEQKGSLISKAILILEGLRAYINLEKGGMVAENLDALYGYMVRRLFEANYQNSVDLLMEVAQLAEEIRAGWVGIRQDALVYLARKLEETSC